MTRYRMGDCKVVIYEEFQRVVTTFGDGRKLVAAPVQNPSTQRRAAELGYKGDDPVWEMTRDHDLCHTLLATSEGLPHSPTLYGAAGGPPIGERAVHVEECRVFLLQRLLVNGRHALREFEVR